MYGATFLWAGQNRLPVSLPTQFYGHAVLGYDLNMEYVFEVTQEHDGGYVAECLNESIVTQADSWDELRANVKEAVQVHCFNGEMPKSIRLRLVRNEVLLCA